MSRVLCSLAPSISADHESMDSFEFLLADVLAGLDRLGYPTDWRRDQHLADDGTLTEDESPTGEAEWMWSTLRLHGDPRLTDAVRELSRCVSRIDSDSLEGGDLKGGQIGELESAIEAVAEILPKRENKGRLTEEEYDLIRKYANRRLTSKETESKTAMIATLLGRSYHTLYSNKRVQEILDDSA